MKQNFHLLVGIVGSGKSTYGKHLAAQTGAVVVSSDDIRLEVAGDMTNQSKNHYIFSKVIPDRIKAGLALGKDVVYDATNYNRKNRRDILILANTLGFNVIAHVMQTPFDECRRRNAARTERVVPDFVIDRMVTGWEAPDKNIEKIHEIKLV